MVQLVGERHWCEASFYKKFPDTYLCFKVCIFCLFPKGPSAFGTIRRLCILYPSIPGDIRFHSKSDFFLLLVGSKV